METSTFNATARRRDLEVARGMLAMDALTRVVLYEVAAKSDLSREAQTSSLYLHAVGPLQNWRNDPEERAASVLRVLDAEVFDLRDQIRKAPAVLARLDQIFATMEVIEDEFGTNCARRKEHT